MNLKIAVLPGDGIGPEVTNESIKVLKCIADKYNHKIDLSEGPVGAIAGGIMGHGACQAGQTGSITAWALSLKVTPERWQ